MGKTVYVRDETNEIIESLQMQLGDLSKTEVMDRALRAYASSIPEYTDSKNSSPEFQPPDSVQIEVSDGTIEMPSRIGDFVLEEQIQEGYIDMGPLLRLRYSSDEKSVLLDFDFLPDTADVYRVRIFDEGEELIEESEHEVFEVALSRLYTTILPLDDTLLQPREYQVWWLTRDFTYEEVAEWLDIGIGTVRRHIYNISQKRETAQQTLNFLSRPGFSSE